MKKTSTPIQTYHQKVFPLIKKQTLFYTMSQEGDDGQDSQAMEIDELGTRLTLPPPSVREGAIVVTRATRAYKEEMGTEDAVGDDRDIPDKSVPPSSPGGATDLGAKSDDEILSLAGHLGKQHAHGSRSSSRTRKSLFPPGPGPSRSDSELPKVPTTPRHKDPSQASRGKALSSKQTIPKDPKDPAPSGSTQITNPNDHPLLRQIDVESDTGFEILITQTNTDKSIPDALHLIKANATKAASQGGPIPTFEEARNVFPVTTAKSWAGSTAIMLATIDKMAKLFRLPDFKIVYDKTQTAFVILNPPSVSQTNPSKAGRQSGAVFTFPKMTVDACTETETGPTPSKVSKQGDSGNDKHTQTSFIDTDPCALGSVTGESAQQPEDQIMGEDGESEPPRLASMLADESTPAPSRHGSPHEAKEDQMPKAPPLSIKMPEPCVVTSPFGQRIELDVLRLVSPDVLRAKLGKWNFLPVYLLADDPVIKQLCCFMAIGNESFYGVVNADTLNKFIALLQAAPST
uniref:Uncharacterized protein n=1 Tax=Taishun Tick Virus TaxID=1608090 RepID=A0A7S8F968_9RHAB|nr:hypothetical protein [Taishun Tick Virus]